MEYFLLLVLICKLYAPTESLSVKNLGVSAVNIVKGVVEKIPDAIPSAEDLLQYGKNAIAGYPFEKVNTKHLHFMEKVINEKKETRMEKFGQIHEQKIKKNIFFFSTGLRSNQHILYVVKAK